MEDMEVRVALISDRTKERVSHSVADEFREIGFEPFYVEGKGKFNLSGIMGLREIIKKGNVRIVHSHNYKSDIYVFMASIGNRRIKRVATCHNWTDEDFKSRVYGMLDRHVLKHFDAVVAVSESVYDRLLKSGVSQERLKLIGNSVLPDDCVIRRTRNRLDNAMGLLSIAYVGRLSKEKGVDVLLRACSRLAKTAPQIRYSLRVVGEGPERVNLERLCLDVMQEGTVVWTGFRRDVPAILAETDVFVLPSRIEASPIVVLEAMAAGCAIVATNVGDIPKRIKDGRNGILIPPDDDEALEKALRRLAVDSTLRHRLASQAKEDFWQYHAKSGIFEEYACIYRRLI